MKKSIKTIAVFTALIIVAVSCQKETENLSVQSNEYVATSNVASYKIDGKIYCELIKSEQDWSVFLYRMLALAEEGYTVTVSSRVAATSASKEVVTYTTTDKTDAYNWSDNMSNHGYDVTISFNNSTGVYTCIAIKK